MKEKQYTKETFIRARKEKKKVLLTYFSGEYKLFLTKLCVPINYVHSGIDLDNDYYYFWDEQADIGDRLFGLPPSGIKYLELTEESYDPNDYIVPNTSEV